MRLPLVLLLLGALAPMFAGRLRLVPLALAAQALALGWIGLLQHGDGASLHALASFVEVLLLRVLLVPWLLARVVRRRGSAQQELLPPNLFSWAIGIGLIALAFDFAGAAMADAPGLALGVVGALVATALLLLASSEAPDVQLVALLYMENAIAVFEFLLPLPWPLAIHVLLSLVYLLTVGLGSWLMAEPEAAP